MQGKIKKEEKKMNVDAGGEGESDFSHFHATWSYEWMFATHGRLLNKPKWLVMKRWSGFVNWNGAREKKWCSTLGKRSVHERRSFLMFVGHKKIAKWKTKHPITTLIRRGEGFEGRSLGFLLKTKSDSCAVLLYWFFIETGFWLLEFIHSFGFCWISFDSDVGLLWFLLQS